MLKMEQEKYFIELTKNLFKSPNVPISMGTVIAILIVYELIVRLSITNFLYLFLIPYLILILLDVIFLHLFKQYFPIVRISLLNEIVFLFTFVAYLILSIFFVKNFVVALLLAVSMSTFLRYLFLKPFLSVGEKKLSFMSMFYVFSLTITYFFSDKSYFYLISFYISSILFIFASRFFLFYLSREFKNEFDLDPVKYVGYFINYISIQRPEEMLSLNNFLSKMYSLMELPLHSLIIKNGSGKIKAMLIFPYVHPGPFGEVGCSDLPRRLYAKLKDLSENVLVFHTSCTHNENCGGDEDMEKIATSIRNNIKDIKYSSKVSEIIRISDHISIRAQVFDNTALVTLIPDKEGFDDITLDLGMKIMRKLRSAKIKNVIVVDAHNSFDKSYKALDNIDQNLLNDLKTKLNDTSFENIKCGIGQTKIDTKSIGPLGIQAVIFQGKKKYGYILIDGNNIEKGLREKIMEKVKNKIDDVEVYSTDNHIVNINPKDLNPVGNGANIDEILSSVDQSIDMALNNMENVYIGFYGTKLLLRIAGKGYIDKMSFYVKRMIKRLRISILIVILTFIFSLFIFIISFIFIG
ncbi:MAG: DUF2070 family protein [Thermoplasmata archaeon]